MGDEQLTVNLFVYGSLRDSVVFRSICGLGFTRKASRVDAATLFAELAFLSGYRRVSPDNVYYYAVATPAARIEGLVIHDVTGAALEDFDRYEGRYYKRDTVTVHTAQGPITAEAYLVSPESMQKHFGDRFHVNLIHELWLRKRIGQFIRRRTRPGERSTDAKIERQADRELLATTERDLVIAHYGTDSISDYYLEHQLDKPRPSIGHLQEDPQARPFIRNYLVLVVRQVLLNQLDERFQTQYRYELEHWMASERYFKRSISLVAALHMMNVHSPEVDRIIEECLKTMPFERHDLFEYVKYAVRAARSLFEPRLARATMERIQANLQGGLVPLGCEMELSNQGASAVEPYRSDGRAFDPVYDGFRYFYDFRLDVLCWKLGGYIDDHSGSGDRSRRCGFLELAPGRLSIGGDLSRPATADPWLLNQLIHEIAHFYDVRPHSLHLSFQLRRRQIGRQRILPLDYVKCLLALGGGPEPRGDGGVWLSRLGRGEIVQLKPVEELVLARTSKRKWHFGTDRSDGRARVRTTTHVQQYKFIRLDRRANYEPLILCLKGLQLAYNPGDYLTAAQMEAQPALRDEYEELKRWALDPTPIPADVLGRFLGAVHEGLAIEGHRVPVHNLHYIDWTLGAIGTQIRLFNDWVGGGGGPAAGG